MVSNFEALRYGAIIEDLNKRFEDAKRRLDPVLEKNNSYTYIYRIKEDNNGHFAGDGFGYAGHNKIFWRYGMTGHDEPATLGNVWGAMKHFKDKNISLEGALRAVAQILEEKCLDHL